VQANRINQFQRHPGEFQFPGTAGEMATKRHNFSQLFCLLMRPSAPKRSLRGLHLIVDPDSEFFPRYSHRVEAAGVEPAISSAEMIFQIGHRRFRSLAAALSIRMPSSASADRSWGMTEARTLRRLPPRAFIGSTAPIRNGAPCFTMVMSGRWDYIAWLDSGHTFSANRSSCWI